MAEHVIDKFAYGGNVYKLQDNVSGYQAELVSGTNIKTINGSSILGSGDMSVGGGSTVSVTQSLTSGTQVGSISVDGTSTTLYAPTPPTASTTAPSMDGTASYGSGTSYARSNHVHPTDTSRQATLVSGTNIKTVNGASLLGSGDIDTAELPSVTASDNGKVLTVESGAWAAATPSTGGRQATYYTTCSTAASTAAKSITVTGWTPQTGDILGVYFSAANTAATPTFTINGTTGYAWLVGNTAINSTTNVLKWSAATMLWFQYDGTYFRYLASQAQAGLNPTDGAGSWYGTSTTASATAAKTSTIANFRLVPGARVAITFSYAQTTLAALTLNINSTGAKAIYVHDKACSTSYCLQWGIGETVEFVYSGSYWYAIGKDAVLYSDSTGVGGSSSLTLSNSAANYDYLDFIYTDGTRQYTHRLYQPDGKTTSLERIVIGSSTMYYSVVMVSVSGTTVTTGAHAQSNSSGTAISTSTSDDNIKIIQVRGGK